jgi:hypothetical protein
MQQVGACGCCSGAGARRPGQCGAAAPLRGWRPAAGLATGRQRRSGWARLGWAAAGAEAQAAPAALSVSQPTCHTSPPPPSPAAVHGRQQLRWGVLWGQAAGAWRVQLPQRRPVLGRVRRRHPPRVRRRGQARGGGGGMPAARAPSRGLAALCATCGIFRHAAAAPRRPAGVPAWCACWPGGAALQGPLSLCSARGIPRCADPPLLAPRRAASSYGVYLFSSGQRYEGHWSKGKKHGWSIYTVETGQRWAGSWGEGGRPAASPCLCHAGSACPCLPRPAAAGRAVWSGRAPRPQCMRNQRRAFKIRSPAHTPPTPPHLTPPRRPIRRQAAVGAPGAARRLAGGRCAGRAASGGAGQP